jgi:hypothetical protein
MDAATTARQTWELENDVVELDPRTDAIFHHDPAEQRRILAEAPWKRE